MRRRAVIFILLAGVAGLLYWGHREQVNQPIPDDPKASGPQYERGERALGGAVTIAPARSDAVYRRDFLETFTSLTPENEMKWEQIEPSRGRRKYGDADRLVEWGEREGKRVRGHPLIWDQQIPAWLRDGGFDAQELEKLERDHVTRMVERYRGRIESWDAVNEPFEDDGSWSKTTFYNALGERFVEIAFSAAHAADPDARLFLNELAAERDGPKQDALFELVSDLKERGVPIDGVGFQNHTEAGAAPTRSELTATLERFAALGLDVELTEMDVELDPGAPASDQSPAFVDAAQACRAVDRCTGLTVWGVTDRYSWLTPAKRPTLYDEAGEPKPARAALLEAWP